MKKNFRWLTALAVVGTVIGLVIAYICKKNREASMEEDVFEEEDDFALDSDLKPVSEREYVPLNKAEKKEPEPETADSAGSEEISGREEESETDKEGEQDKTEDGTDEDSRSGKE